MKKSAVAVLLVLCTLGLALRIVRANNTRTGKIPLPSSKLILAPVPGNPQPTNSFPNQLAVSPDGQYVAVLNNGYGTFQSQYSESIAILDVSTNQLTDYPDARLGNRAHQTYFCGLAFSADGKRLFASMSSMTDPEGKSPGDSGSGIAVYDFADGKLTPSDFIHMPASSRPASKKTYAGEDASPDANARGTTVPFPAGIVSFNRQGKEMLLVADNLSDEAHVIDVAAKQQVSRVDLAVFKPVPSSYPLAVAVSKDGSTGYVSLWNASRVAEIDLNAGRVKRMIELHKPASDIAPGSHPTALLLSPDESHIFIALANTDEVAVVDRGSGAISYLSTKLPGQQYGGSYPIGLAMSADGKDLFVANASSDAVAVFTQFSQGARPAGFIPTEWYPTALAVNRGELFIATGKGQGTGPNKGLPLHVASSKERGGYIASLLHGSVARIPLNDVSAHLADWTEQVLASNLMRGNSDTIAFAGGGKPLKHVIYVIKENRSFDQVLGDIGVGDADPSLVMFGDDVTPNEHKLARQFGVLDNFYDSGEVSGDGHVWSTAAITSDYTEQNWEINYRSKERSYDFAGVVDNRYPLLEGIPDVNEPATGYLWTNFAKHGITFRHYGEFISTHFCNIANSQEMPQAGDPLLGSPCPKTSINKGEPLPDYLGQPHGSPSPWPWAIPLIAKNIAVKPELREHFDPRFPDFNLNYPDQLRADEFLNEFSQFVAKRKGGRDDMPQFILLRLPNDHTSGTKAGIATPAAAVADNDLALGRVADAVSHSPYWQDTAIFVLEDDAQNGADHVDAHRSTAFVISRFSPRQGNAPFVDHTFYTTVNMLRTMEAILGAPPMNNNDARAAVMAPLFSGGGSQPAFTADTRNRDNGLIYTANPPKGPDAGKSSKLDFSHADAADAGELNAILWRNRMGSRSLPRTPGAEFRQ